MSVQSDTRTAGAGDVAVDFDAIVVGAGVAGIRTLYELRELGLKVQVLESGTDVGGTWYWNRYPGARTDSEAWVYAFCFSQEVMDEWSWTERYPTQPEVQRYLSYVADKFDMRKDIQFGTQLVTAVFDEDSDTWLASTAAGDTYRTRFLLTGLGHSSMPYRPPLDSLDDFQGQWYQSSRWPQEPVDFTGKRVAVVGTGASGVQIIPLVAEQAEHVTVFQRTPNWVIPSGNHPLGEEDWREIRANYSAIWEKVFNQAYALPYNTANRKPRDVSADEQEKILEHAYKQGGFRYLFETFDEIGEDEESNRVTSGFLRKKIHEIVKDPVAAELLSPKYPLLAKRPPLGHFYYETFNRDNVSLVDVSQNPIVDATPTGLRLTDGAQYDFDAIIFATGFDAVTGSYRTIDLVGRGGVRLLDKWKDGARTNLGAMVDDFPNLFLVDGPHVPFANIPVVVDREVRFIGRTIGRMLEHNQRFIEPTVEATDKWTDLISQLLEGSLLATGAQVNSWFLGANIPGKPVGALSYHGGANNYFAALDEEFDNNLPGFTRR